MAIETALTFVKNAGQDIVDNLAPKKVEELKRKKTEAEIKLNRRGRDLAKDKEDLKKISDTNTDLENKEKDLEKLLKTAKEKANTEIPALQTTWGQLNSQIIELNNQINTREIDNQIETLKSQTAITERNLQHQQQILNGSTHRDAQTQRNIRRGFGEFPEQPISLKDLENQKVALQQQLERTKQEKNLNEQQKKTAEEKIKTVHDLQNKKNQKDNEIRTLTGQRDLIPDTSEGDNKSKRLELQRKIDDAEDQKRSLTQDLLQKQREFSWEDNNNANELLIDFGNQQRPQNINDPRVQLETANQRIRELEQVERNISNSQINISKDIAEFSPHQNQLTNLQKTLEEQQTKIRKLEQEKLEKFGAKIQQKEQLITKQNEAQKQINEKSAYIHNLEEQLNNLRGTDGQAIERAKKTKEDADKQKKEIETFETEQKTRDEQIENTQKLQKLFEPDGEIDKGLKEITDNLSAKEKTDKLAVLRKKAEDLCATDDALKAQVKKYFDTLQTVLTQGTTLEACDRMIELSGSVPKTGVHVEDENNPLGNYEQKLKHFRHEMENANTLKHYDTPHGAIDIVGDTLHARQNNAGSAARIIYAAVARHEFNNLDENGKPKPPTTSPNLKISHGSPDTRIVSSVTATMLGVQARITFPETELEHKANLLNEMMLDLKKENSTLAGEPLLLKLFARVQESGDKQLLQLFSSGLSLEHMLKAFRSTKAEDAAPAQFLVDEIIQRYQAGKINDYQLKQLFQAMPPVHRVDFAQKFEAAVAAKYHPSNMKWYNRLTGTYTPQEIAKKQQTAITGVLSGLDTKTLTEVSTNNNYPPAFQVMAERMVMASQNCATQAQNWHKQGQNSLQSQHNNLIANKT